MSLPIKIIEIPLFDDDIKIHWGEKGKEIFDKTVSKFEPEYEIENESDGLNYRNMIWIKNIKDKRIMYHELSHTFDFLFLNSEIAEESEFKACIVSFVLVEIDKFYANEYMEEET